MVTLAEAAAWTAVPAQATDFPPSVEALFATADALAERSCTALSTTGPSVFAARNSFGMSASTAAFRAAIRVEAFTSAASTTLGAVQCMLERACALHPDAQFA